jgi:hypothetical protein
MIKGPPASLNAACLNVCGSAIVGSLMVSDESRNSSGLYKERRDQGALGELALAQCERGVFMPPSSAWSVHHTELTDSR